MCGCVKFQGQKQKAGRGCEVKVPARRPPRPAKQNQPYGSWPCFCASFSLAALWCVLGLLVALASARGGGSCTVLDLSVFSGLGFTSVVAGLLCVLVGGQQGRLPGCSFLCERRFLCSRRSFSVVPSRAFERIVSVEGGVCLFCPRDRQCTGGGSAIRLQILTR